MDGTLGHGPLEIGVSGHDEHALSGYGGIGVGGQSGGVQAGHLGRLPVAQTPPEIWALTVTVDAVVYYRISDPLYAVVQVEDYSLSTRLLAATTLRNIVGTRNLSELLTEREILAHTMQSTLDEATEPWGVMVERVEM